MKQHHYVVALAATFLALTACGKAGVPGAADKNTEPSVATVNGKPVNATAFELYASSIARKPIAQLTGEQKDQLLDQYIGMMLAAEAAEKSGLEKGKELAAQMAVVRVNLLADAQFKKYLAEHPIADTEIKAEYDAQVAKMPREYHPRFIVVENKVIADSLIRELKKGADFSKLAKDESKDPSSKSGGDLGWLTPDSLPKTVAAALTTLEKGKFTEEPVQSELGWYVVQLDETREATPPDFEQVKDKVKQLVQAKKVQTMMEELRKTAKVEKKS